MAAVHALTQGANAQIISLGRYLAGNVYPKHKIKRMDRLISNPHLYKERHSIYTVLTRRLVAGLAEPIILIDWSPLCADQRWQLLRAALPVGGRTITLYEEVHAKKANEPWLLVVSLSLHERTPKQIVKLYYTWMQIKEGFRDCKAVHYGLNLS